MPRPENTSNSIHPLFEALKGTHRYQSTEPNLSNIPKSEPAACPERCRICGHSVDEHESKCPNDPANFLEEPGND